MSPDYKPSKFVYLYSVLAGVAYGLAFRWGAGLRSPILHVMSLPFIFGVPIGIGLITVAVAEREGPQRVALWIFLPWVTVCVSLLGTFIAAWEGLICIVMWAPIACVCGSIGGLIAGLFARFMHKRPARNVSLMIFAAVPFLISPITQKFFYDYRVRTVSTSIDIDAPPEIVWRNIERVPAIQSSELKPVWSRRIGFPAPDEATLSYEGVGAIRHATFKGGILFIETVDTWEPNHRLAFSIHAETERIPNTTLDEHVRIGGPYFDVLHGDYEIERLQHGVTRLHLSSRQRVSTDFNWYAHLWTDAVMRDIQNSILYVIKTRCEKQTKM